MGPWKVLLQEFCDSGFGSTDDGLLAFHDHGSLQQRLSFDQQIDNGFRVPDIVIRVEIKLLELRVLTDEIFNGVLETLHDSFECCTVRWFLHVQHDVRIDTQFLGDRQGILG